MSMFVTHVNFSCIQNILNIHTAYTSIIRKNNSTLLISVYRFHHLLKTIKWGAHFSLKIIFSHSFPSEYRSKSFQNVSFAFFHLNYLQVKRLRMLKIRTGSRDLKHPGVEFLSLLLLIRHLDNVTRVPSEAAELVLVLICLELLAADAFRSRLLHSIR